MIEGLQWTSNIVISVEGYDNAGKTTFIEAFEKRVNELTKERGHPCKVYVLSASNTYAGRRIKKDYKNKYEFEEGEELAMHMYSISEVMFNIDSLRLRVNDEKWEHKHHAVMFIIDRFADSTVAYAGAENDDGVSHEIWLWHWSCIKKVAYTLYLDLDEDLYLERLKLKNDKIEHPKERDIEHYRRVTKNYNKLIKSRERFKNYLNGGQKWEVINSRNLIDNLDHVVDGIARWVCFREHRR